MSWCEVNKEGTAIYDFEPKGDFQITLNVNDRVCILEEAAGWLRGYVIGDEQNRNGIFPASFIEIDESEDERESVAEEEAKQNFLETAEQAQIRRRRTAENISIEALKSEITDSLNKWSAQQRAFMQTGEVEKYHQNKERMSTLLDLRRQVLSHSIPEPERKQLRADIVSLIESSRRQDEGFMVPRNEKGEMADDNNTGIIRLLTLHREMHETTLLEEKTSIWKQIVEQRQLTQAQSRDEQKYNPQDKFPVGKIQLYVDVKACIFRVGEPTDLHYSLYSKKLDVFLTEDFVLSLTANGMPPDVDLWGNIKTIFQDLDHRDYESDVYLVCKIYRKGALLYDEEAQKKKKKDAGVYRRPFGCACMPLSGVGLQKMMGQEYTPANKSIKIYTNAIEQDFQQLHRMIIHHSPNLEEVPLAKGVALGIILFSGEMKDLLEEYPEHKLDAIEPTRKILFDEIISPTEPRNDMFITLDRGRFQQDAMKVYRDGKLKAENKKAAKNVQVSLRVLLDDGTHVKDCIYIGSGHGSIPLSEYCSTVYYHSNTPFFDETFRINVPSDVLNRAHLFITVTHVSSNSTKASPFGFGFLPLVEPEGVMIRNTPHELLIHHPFPNMNQKNDAFYLRHVPDNNRRNGNTRMPGLRKDTLIVGTRLASTQNTHNIILHNVFHWKKKQNQLLQVLRDCTGVAGSEIVHYLRESFDMLFELLHEKRNNKEICFAAYSAILYMVEQLTCTARSDWANLVDIYVDEIFHNPSAHHILLTLSRKCFKYASTHDVKREQVVFNALTLVCKCCKYVLRFIVASREADKQLAHPSCADDVFKSAISEMLADMDHLLKIETPTLILCKAFLLKMYAEMFPYLTSSFTPVELGSFALNFITALPEQRGSRKLYVDKLKLMLNLTRGPVGQQKDARQLILPTVLDVLKEHLAYIRSGELDEPAICISIVKELLRVLQADVLRPEGAIWGFSIILPELSLVVLRVQQSQMGEVTLVPPSAEVSKYSKLDLLPEASTCLWTILSLMSDHEVDHYLSQLPKLELQDFLLKMMQVMKNTLKARLFPDLWIVMQMVEHSLIVRLMNRFSVPIKQHFSGENFSYEMWQRFFDLGIRVCVSPVLKSKGFTKARQQFLKNRYGDIREHLCEDMGTMWDFLGATQLKFVGFLIPELIELTRCGKMGKKLGMRIYYDMLYQEFQKTGRFTDVESYTIDSLYQTIIKNQRHLSDKFVERLVNIVGGKLNNNEQLSEIGTKFLGHIEHLYRLMHTLQDFPKTEIYEDERTDVALKLMDYLENNVQIRKDMFFTYVQYLVELHYNINNYIEAGMTQLQHIRMVDWCDNEVIAVGPFRASTERLRKEALYKSTISFFEVGEHYEKCIEMCEELCQYYRHELYDYDKLARTMKQSADFFQKISSNTRYYSNYYRLVFYGDFNEDMLGKEFVYRGGTLEPVMDFSNRIKTKWPEAKLIMSSEEPDEKTLESTKQAISVTTLNVSIEDEMERKIPEPGPHDANRPLEVVKNQKNTNLNVFYYNKTIQKGGKNENEYANLWVQRTFLKTRVTFPTNRRRTDVVERKEVMLKPIVNAIEAVTSKTGELDETAMEVKFAPPGDVDVNRLSMNLNGMIDAAVSGGTKHYVEAFLSDEYLSANLDSKDDVARLRQALLEQQQHLGVALDIFGRRCGEKLQELYAHLRGMYGKMREANATVLGTSLFG